MKYQTKMGQMPKISSWPVLMKGWVRVLPRELEDIGLDITPQYDPCEYETQNIQMFLKVVDELEPMPKVGEHDIEAETCCLEGLRWQWSR